MAIKDITVTQGALNARFDVFFYDLPGVFNLLDKCKEQFSEACSVEAEQNPEFIL